MKRALTAALTLAALAPAPGIARAESHDCTAAAEAGQLLRNSGKLVQAKDRFLACIKACPAVVKNDCGQWLHDVEARLGSIVIRATDPSYHEISDVRVSADGELVTSRLDGLAVPLDPGMHRLTFEREGSPTITEDLTIREGEKARGITVHFERPPTPKDETPAPAPTKTESRFPSSAVVLGGVGLVGMGLFTVYHVAAKSDLDALRADCAPRCSQDQVDTLDTKIFVSNVALGIGIAALVGAVVVYFVESRPPSSAKTGVRPASLVVRF